MEFRCPRCNSKAIELIECEDCGSIGCTRCMKRKYGRWVCFRCEEPKRRYYYEIKPKRSEDKVVDAFSAMFG